jgi:hypothetical protein
LWPVLWILWRRLHRDQPTRLPLAHEAGHGLLIVVVSIYVVNFGYAFEKPLQPLRSFEVGRSLLAKIDASLPGGAASAGSALLGSLPVPFPEKYVGGIDAIARQRRQSPYTYLCGEMRQSGWWYYYPYAMLVKLPVGTLALVGLASFLWLTARPKNDLWKTELLLLVVPFLVVLCFVTWVSTGQRLRYGLPMLPFIYVLTGRTGQEFSARRLLPALVGLLLLAWSVASSLWVYPHSGSYFNGLAGGPKCGHEHLFDTNIDWGQDLFYLKKWYDRHPEARPFHLAYFGSVDPRIAGLEFSPPPRNLAAAGLKPGSLADRGGPAPGWFAVSTHLLHTYPMVIADGKGGMTQVVAADYDYFLRLRPVAMAGYSIFIYHVRLEEANALRRQLGMPELDSQVEPP